MKLDFAAGPYVGLCCNSGSVAPLGFWLILAQKQSSFPPPQVTHLSLPTPLADPEPQSWPLGVTTRLDPRSNGRRARSGPKSIARGSPGTPCAAKSALKAQIRWRCPSDILGSRHSSAQQRCKPGLPLSTQAHARGPEHNIRHTSDGRRRLPRTPPQAHHPVGMAPRCAGCAQRRRARTKCALM